MEKKWMEWKISPPISGGLVGEEMGR